MGCCFDTSMSYTALLGEVGMEMDDYNRIIQFDWNQGKSSDVEPTVEEIIMMRMCNDNTDFINPQCAHIIFSEFKKFMFLNTKYLLKTKKTRKSEDTDKIYLHNTPSDSNYEIGLFAPPVIDQIWCILLSLNIPYDENDPDKTIYEGFCEEIFGTRLDRPVIQEDYLPPDLKIKHTYSLTLKYLKCFELSLNPFPLVWPHYEDASYIVDIKSTVYVPVSEKYTIVDQCISKCCIATKSLCYSSIGLTANNIIDSYSNQIRLEPSNENYVREYMRKKKNYIKNEAPVGFPDLSKVKVDNFWKKVNTHIYGKETLVKRLSQKYGLEYNTAETWIFEFKKFFTLKLLEAEFEADWELLQCSIVECVWSTYIELGVIYRKFSHALFPDRVIYPKQIIFAKEESYKSTLKIYTFVFGVVSYSNHWESISQRFGHLEGTMTQTVPELTTQDLEIIYDDFCKRIPINFFRLCFIISLRSSVKNAIIPEIIICKKLKGTNFEGDYQLVSQEREEALKESKSFLWRENYPHCTNIYFKHLIIYSDRKNIEIPEYGCCHEEIPDAFSRGGIFFFPNPFDKLFFNTNKPITEIIEDEFDTNKKVIYNYNIDTISDIILKESNAVSELYIENTRE
ncbi:unnamed protein product [Moneuplotes crassus]|uniref:Uncharacterized protein n=1 Tax=Euplotes crassus TaxID=5936 RepID=A0AAD1U236_EUPCR|nr:unnamed protein product [Moneuplotes crassus]